MICCNQNSSTVSTVSIGSTALLLTPDVALSPSNYDKVFLRMATGIPGGETLPVAVVLNGENVNVYDRAGNIVYGNQIVKGLRLNGYFGSNGVGGADHFQVMTLPIQRCG